MTRVEAIRALLWKEWDPIGVNDTAEAFGEYDSYADQIGVMLDRGADAEEIARHLSWIAVELMGLRSNDRHSLAVANKLVALLP